MMNEKIFENEVLSDEELEKIDGGSSGQTYYESKLLYERGLIDEWHGAFPTVFHWETYSNLVDEGWKKAGITCVTKPLADNKYYMNGQEISMKMARNYLINNFPKIRDC